MARAGTPLDTGDPFVALSFVTLAHGRMALPDAFAGRWAAVLFYRAHW